MEEKSKRSIPQPREFYRHFKGGLYQIIGLAKDADTLEEQVVYQALYGSYGLWIRPLAEFVSPVDKEKYPEASQTWRFEKVHPAGKATVSSSAQSVTENRTAESKSSVEEENAVKTAAITKAAVTDSATPEACENGAQEKEENNVASTATGNTENRTAPAGNTGNTTTGNSVTGTTAETAEDEKEKENTSEETEQDTFVLDPLVEQFLDADTISDQLQILDALRPRVTDSMIDTMAIAAGVEVAQGDVQTRLYDLKECLKTIERYEQTRDRFR